MRGALAVDESGNNNDAMLINGAEIVYEGGKCDSGVSLLGMNKYLMETFLLYFYYLYARLCPFQFGARYKCDIVN